nr:hypothetical protein CFP56_25827 [Quercus suber]
MMEKMGKRERPRERGLSFLFRQAKNKNAAMPKKEKERFLAFVFGGIVSYCGNGERKKSCCACLSERAVRTVVIVCAIESHACEVRCLTDEHIKPTTVGRASSQLASQDQ